MTELSAKAQHWLDVLGLGTGDKFLKIAMAPDSLQYELQEMKKMGVLVSAREEIARRHEAGTLSGDWRWSQYWEDRGAADRPGAGR